jgi:hypothetical protein
MQRGWFSTPDRPGDRTLADQLKGLDWLVANCRGRTVLYIGCAEGLIAIALATCGAAAVKGVEIVPAHVDVANVLRGDLPVTFEVADANVWQPQHDYDIVIALALLHKLRDPSAACARFARAARDVMVLRLPPKHAPVIVDPRSGNEPHDIGRVMRMEGFRLDRASLGHFGEWVGYFVRCVD